MSDYALQLLPTIVTRINDAFRALLETKHLYQYVEVDLTHMVVTMLVSPGPTSSAWKKEPDLDSLASSICAKRWILVSSKQEAPTFSIHVEPPPVILPPDIRVFCNAKCKSLQPFNLVKCVEFMVSDWPKNELHQGRERRVQAFVLSYLCQLCKRVPEVFLVRRDDTKLTLSGRAPIEHIDVPKWVPEPISKYFSRAVVAYQSGETLAANFLLRTLIEQFAYGRPGSSKTAREAVEEYTTSLPDELKSWIPSFTKFYQVLSDDIHTATGSVKVFNDSSEAIVTHFEARVAFKKSGKTLVY